MSAQQSNAVANRPKTDVAQQEMTLQSLVKRYEANIREALPSHVKPERILSVIKTAITTNPGLAKCSPLSVLSGIVAASRLGLEIDPALGQAYLVPRWNKNTGRLEATFQIGYRGKLDLIHRADPTINVQVRHVREHDDFELVYDPRPKLRHVINHKKPRGAVVASYTYVEYADGRVEVFEPMTIDQAYDIRDRFGPRERCKSCWGKREERKNCRACNGTGEGPDITGPWVTDTEEMVRKTCFHRDSKWIAQSVEMKDSVRIENRMDSGEAPETVILDLPVEDTESAEIAGNTDRKQQDLRERLDQKKAEEAAKKEAKESSDRGQGQSNPPEEEKSPAGSGDQIREFDDLNDVDPLDFQLGARIRVDGVTYTPNEEGTGWKKVEEGKPAEQKRPPRPGPRSGRGSNALDFDGGQ